MRKKILFLIVYGFALTASAQHLPTLKCRTAEGSVRNADYVQQVKNIIAANPRPIPNSGYTIPVVFHVFQNSAIPNDYKGLLENKSFPLLIPKILNEINKNFNKQNDYLKYTPQVFLDEAGAAGINLCLAQRTNTGIATNGIVIHPEVVAYVPNEKDFEKAYTMQFDKYVWDTDKYINIFLVPGYGYTGLTYYDKDIYPPFTTAENSYEGCKSKILINISTLQSDPNSYTNKNFYTPAQIKEFKDKKFSVVKFLSATTSHEIGHYLGLNHIFGNSDCADDGFSDTPLQEYYTMGINATFPLFDKCNKDDGKSNGVMFHNTMDAYYFTSMFTKQQCTYMQQFLTTKRAKLLDSDGCKLGTCLADDFEPNESIENATELNFPASYLATLCKDDKDFYRISLPFKQSIKVKLLSLPEDYSLGLSYEKDGEFILDESDNDGLASEELIANDIEEGVVYIEVSSKKGGYHPLSTYLLAVETSLGTFSVNPNSIQRLNTSSISPNPSTGQINITIGEKFNQGELINMTINDLYGNKKFEKQLILDKNEFAVELNSLREGVYLIKLAGQNTNEVHRLVIKK